MHIIQHHKFCLSSIHKFDNGDFTSHFYLCVLWQITCYIIIDLSTEFWRIQHWWLQKKSWLPYRNTWYRARFFKTCCRAAFSVGGRDWIFRVSILLPKNSYRYLLVVSWDVLPYKRVRKSIPKWSQSSSDVFISAKAAILQSVCWSTLMAVDLPFPKGYDTVSHPERAWAGRTLPH